MKQLLANTAKICAVVVLAIGSVSAHAQIAENVAATPRNGCPTPATASPYIPTSAPTSMRSIIRSAGPPGGKSRSDAARGGAPSGRREGSGESAGRAGQDIERHGPRRAAACAFGAQVAGFFPPNDTYMKHTVMKNTV